MAVKKQKVIFYGNLTKKELYTNELKIDLDLNKKSECISQLRERFTTLSYFDLVTFNSIEKVELIKKKKYSCKVTLKGKLNPYFVLVIQSILGDDYKRTIVCLRDFCLDSAFNWNRLFNIKVYNNKGKIIIGRVTDITKLILTKK